MDVRIFNNASSIQTFYMHGFSVMSDSDAVCSRDLDIAPVAFAQPYIFSTVERAEIFIQQHDLTIKGFRVWKVFDCYGCRGYAGLDNEDEALKKLMEEEKEHFLSLNDFFDD